MNELSLETKNSQKNRSKAPMISANSKKPYIYHFSQGETQGSSQMKNILGGKGANLAEMCQLGLPVPPGFTLSTELCQLFYQQNQTLSDDVKKLVKKSLGKLETQLGKKLNCTKQPLLVSVRSGAPISMPGMMDTILNLGLNSKTVEALSELCQDSRFAWDSYRRFIQMYSNVVMGMNASLLEAYLEDFKNQKSYTRDADMQTEDWKEIVAQFKETILQDTGKVFPEDPWEQLWEAIAAVFKSWNNPRACIYRKMNNETDCMGTAVNVQAMVFGNRGDDCATGVIFTRNPSTGEKSLFGEFLVNAQGEDVVAGVRTPQLIMGESQENLKQIMPAIFEELSGLCKKLETHYKYIQDIEFTVEKSKLWLLQTRDAKCSAKAQIQILFDLLQEGLITEKQLITRINPNSLNKILHPTLDEKHVTTPLAKGLPASPGGAIGKIVFSNEKAVEWGKQGIPTILVRPETSPEDINGMVSSQGILTSRGGMTSHAAVVARSMGKPCIVGCETLSINEEAKELKIKGKTLAEGEEITIDGSTGKILLGSVQTKPPDLDKNFFKLMDLSDKYSKLEVRANADTPLDVQKSKEFGAQGVGLCRTEHMFFAPDRINIMRKMILSDNTEERQEALDQLFTMQTEDFYQLLKIMDGHPVTIRFLDPPLHEFLPHTTEDIQNLAKKLEWSEEKVSTKVNLLKETNPMLGHRGCRLAITFPEIYLMQTKALGQACAALKKENKNPKPEIMIPLISLPKELSLLRALVEKEIKDIEAQSKTSLPIPIGTMIELPRACLQADSIAEQADFFSFGTNDLTQTTLGISRDDAGKFLSSYINQKLFSQDPFSTLDQKGVGELLKIAIEKSRNQKPSLKIGICGEHGGDPQSIDFFYNLGLDYISCSPYRIPIARLSSAQATISQEERSYANTKT